MKKNILFYYRKTSSKLLLLVVFLFTLAISAKSQELSSNVLCSAGETFAAQGNTLEFVLGEIATESYTTQGQILTQGFLQGKQGGTSVDESILKHMDIAVYPNPATSQVIVQSREIPDQVEIINMQGNTVFVSEHPQKSLTINISSLPSGIYTIRVSFIKHMPTVKKIAIK